MNKLIFTPEPHGYTFDGLKVPCISNILAEEGFYKFDKIPPKVLEKANARGKAAHKGTYLLDKGILDWSTVHSIVEPYLNAWIAFKKEYEVIINTAEQPMISQKYWFAGTPDRPDAIVRGDKSIIEIKCTFEISPTTAIQTAAHQILELERSKDEISHRYCVQLKPDGKFKVEKFKENDERIFLNALQNYHWKLKKGVIK